MTRPTVDRLTGVLLAATALAFLWTIALTATGGFRLEFAGLRISTRNPDTPLALAIVTAVGLLALWIWKRLVRAPFETRPYDSPPSDIATGGPFARMVRAAVVLAVPGVYFAHVLQFWNDGIVLTSGLSDWLDPYFINYLQEHWLVSVLSLSDPASPPMFWPARGTLGYSHALVMYAPFYAIARIFVDPFPANTIALFLVMMTGSIALYVVLRQVGRLNFVEALLLSIFFFSSANVISGGTGHWTQRASVFLIPPVVLLAVWAVRAREGRARALGAASAGFLAALLLAQEVYTALFALLLVVLLAVPPLLSPAGRGMRTWIVGMSRQPVGRAFALGCYMGLLVFLWWYLDSYLANRGFPDDHLTRQLVLRDPSSWRTPLDFLQDLRLYDSHRTFWLAIGLAVVAWSPRVGWPARGLIASFLIVSLIVVLTPFSFGGFSVWRSVFAPLPGFGAIRDPRRIVYVYELAAIAIAAWFLARLPSRSLLRLGVAGLIGVLLVTDWNPTVFKYQRPMHAFDRWVQAPIAIDPSCRSFFMKPASRDYMSRADNMFGLYSIDAMFIALKTAIPTLNGYSALAPPGWSMAHAHEPGYLPAVADWIAQNRLQGVCILDIDARTMQPYATAPPITAR